MSAVEITGASIEPPTLLLASLLESLGPCHLAAGSGEILYVNRALTDLFQRLDIAIPTSLPQHVANRSLKQSAAVRTALALGPENSEHRFKVLHRRLNGEGSLGQQILTVYEEISGESSALIKRAKERADDFMRVVADWVWETDRDWKISFLVTRDGTLLGRPTKVFLNINLLDLGQFLPNPEHPRARVPQQRQRAAFSDGLFSTCDADGTKKWFLVSAVPIFTEPAGQFDGFRGSASDVTTRLAAEEDARQYRTRLENTLSELRQRNQELVVALSAANAAAIVKNEFLAMMSHELRTPLNAVIGFSELMQMETLGPLGNKGYKGYVTDILQSGQFLLKLINDILDFVKLESGDTIFQPEEVDVLEAVTRCRRLVSEQAKRKSIEIAVTVPGELCVLADPKRLHQTLLNIVSNALKFTPEGGKITISAHDGPMVAIICRDTGIGIAPDHLSSIFEPFRQANSKLSRSHEGTGMGLAIARSIIARQSGTLSISSTEGVGTTVTIELPAFDAMRLKADSTTPTS